MPPKITSKNLSYDTSVPPFLAALRAQASGSSGPDPLLAAQRRTAKKRSGSEEAEDVPLVVDEGGNLVEEVRVDKDGAVVAVEEPHRPRDADGAEPAKPNESASRASIGRRKRKVAKVVGSAADEPGDKDAGTEGGREGGEPEGRPRDRKPKKKKSKKIKLSFDEDEG